MIEMNQKIHDNCSRWTNADYICWTKRNHHR